MTVSLWTLARGQQGSIDHFDDGLEEPYRIRLLELGFHPGEIVSCLHAPALGAPHVFSIANSTFSLDDQVARFIYVNMQDDG